MGGAPLAISLEFPIIARADERSAVVGSAAQPAAPFNADDVAVPVGTCTRDHASHQACRVRPGERRASGVGNSCLVGLRGTARQTCRDDQHAEVYGESRPSGPTIQANPRSLHFANLSYPGSAHRQILRHAPDGCQNPALLAGTGYSFSSVSGSSRFPRANSRTRPSNPGSARAMSAANARPATLSALRR